MKISPICLFLVAIVPSSSGSNLHRSPSPSSSLASLASWTNKRQQRHILKKQQQQQNTAPTKIHRNTILRHRAGSGSGTTSNPPAIRKINPHFAVLFGMILALNAGYINGICLSGVISSSTKQAGSAVTGAWTNSALGFATRNSGQFQFQSKCVLSYIGGSFLAGLFNPYPIPYGMKKLTVRPSFLVAAVALYLSSTMASKGNAGGTSWILLALIATGIQNSVSSSLTKNLMRSAHFSGITSDIGTFLGQSFRGNKENGLKLKCYSVLAMSFWVGGFLSFGVVEKYGSSSLLVSSILYLMFAFFSV